MLQKCGQYTILSTTTVQRDGRRVYRGHSDSKKTIQVGYKLEFNRTIEGHVVLAPERAAFPVFAPGRVE